MKTKKVFNIRIVILVIMCMVSASSMAFAIENIEPSVSISEDESIQYYSTLTKKEMSFLGYSKDEINDIDNYKRMYAENIVLYSHMTRQELNKLGFSEPQIKGFQLMNTKNITLDINADENEINFFLQKYATRAVAATVTMKVAKYSKKGKNNTFKATWNWKGRPVIVGFKDTVAFGWTNGHTLQSYSDLKVKLKCDSPTKPTYTVPNSYKDTSIPDQAVRFKFPTANNGGWLYKSGTAILTLYNDDNKGKTTMSWKFAHGTVRITGFGINISGGSLTIVKGNKQMANGLKTFLDLK